MIWGNKDERKRKQEPWLYTQIIDTMSLPCIWKTSQPANQPTIPKGKL